MKIHVQSLHKNRLFAGWDIDIKMPVKIHSFSKLKNPTKSKELE